MNGKAPKSPFTGSQACLKKNLRPKACSESVERMINSRTIKTTIARTERAQPSIRYRKAASAKGEDVSAVFRRDTSPAWSSGEDTSEAGWNLVFNEGPFMCLSIISTLANEC